MSMKRGIVLSMVLCEYLRELWRERSVYNMCVLNLAREIFTSIFKKEE